MTDQRDREQGRGHRSHLERGCHCDQWPSCVPHGASEFGGGEPDACERHDHTGPTVDWHAVASELAPSTLAEWEAIVQRHTSLAALPSTPPGLDVERLARVLSSEVTAEWLRIVSRHKWSDNGRLASGFATDMARELAAEYARLAQEPDPKEKP